MTPAGEAHRTWALRTIERLMRPEVRLGPSARQSLVRHRRWLGESSSHEPAEWLLAMLRDMSDQYLAERPKGERGAPAPRGVVAPRWRVGAPMPTPPGRGSG